MKRKLIAVLAVLMVAAMVLGACAKTPTVPSTTEKIDWTKVTPAKNIVFWHQHTKDRETALNQIMADFNANNEYGITVTGEYAGSYSEIYTKMLAILNTEAVPDVVVGYQNQIATYQLANSIFDMNTVINDKQYGMPQADQDDFFPGFFAQDVYPLYQNQRLGIAPNRSMEVMYYNMDWLKELGYDAPPTTPDQFREMACKASQQPFSKAKAEGSLGYQLSIDTSRFASWTYAFGGDIYDAKSNQFTMNSQAAIDAMTFIQGLFKDGCARVVSEKYGDQTDFGNGTLLFTVGSSSGLNFYQKAAAEGAGFEWSVAALPHTSKDPVQNIYGASVSIPKSTPERELAAWIFLKYYTSADVQAYWAEQSGYFPVRKSVAEKMTDYMASYPAYKTAFDMLQYGYYEPAVPGYDFVREQVNVVMAGIVDNPTLSVKDELDKLNVFANDTLAEQMKQLAQ